MWLCYRRDGQKGIKDESYSTDREERSNRAEY